MENTQEENKALTLVKEKKENIFLRILNRIKSLFIKAKELEDSDDKIEMVIFDLDGTLWDTEQVTYEVINEVVEKYDFLKEISKEDVAKTMGMTFAETAEIFMPYLEKEKREEILTEMLDLNAKRLTEVGGNVYQGLEEVLVELNKKYKLAIVSNCADGYIESFCDSSELGKYFVDYAAAAKMKVTKAEAIRAVIERNNIGKAIYVGDTIKDFEASKLAQMDFVQAKYGFGQDLKTDYSVNQISELPNVLNDMK